MKYTFKKFINDVHLWLGIASGLILFVVCLTGTIYTFEAEVDEFFNAEKFEAAYTYGAKPLPAEELVSILTAKHEGKLTAINIPEDKTRTYTISLKKSEKERRGTPYYIDQYTGEIKGTAKSKTGDFFLVVMRMHRWLLLDDSGGRIIVGVSTIIFVVLVISGLVLWWPSKLRLWKQGLKIKMSGNWKRTNHDLHNTLGFYSFILLLIMSLTGLCWSFDWYRNGLSTVLGDEIFKGRKEKPMISIAPSPDAKIITVEKIIAATDKELPYKADYQISFTKDSAAIVVYKTKMGFFALAASDKIQLDKYNGKTLKVERFEDKKFNEQIAASIRPLHTGEIFGTFSKILYFISCLIATSLPITGTIIWLNKLKKKPAKTAKKTVVSVEG
ncbi:PepSY-associated TM helix domain-containing protein [Solitalea canadensis]|uniref:Putative iron-regulated membrane protein n=1 Tax=Solitalea canadensis (strain ATCC 29591 / DSM 3403 / JCM 21819 / LMG 8368 / NBRC 15130 / NCIMB 12057 / USAM 9D) TaxID=929556 RepID=H8KW98_SOLCM|nr:PepSY-associated TM helix domain-containing protein [Solitalea canadensis]AFD07890.1 putative iron-regulated membrane protein [Solitalea canadensis DSM 3403]